MRKAIINKQGMKAQKPSMMRLMVRGDDEGRERLESSNH